MDGQPTAAEPKHHYYSTPWPRIPSGSSTPRVNPASSPDSPPGYFPSHLDLLPILFPHQSSLYQDKLLQYNKLVSAGRGGGGGLQTPPLPSPSLASPHAQPKARSRSSSKVSNKDGLHSKIGPQNGHGNRTSKATDIADCALMIPGKEPPHKMSGKKHSDQPAGHGALPNRPPPASAQQNSALPPAQSSSVPSTPHQHARKFSFEDREPSPNATQNHSPRSAYSETNGNVPSLRPLPPRNGGCRHETAIPHSRRRMPYSIGTERLEKIDLSKIPGRLSEKDERELNTDMRELYDRLLPTKDVEINRQKLVRKLEGLFSDEWPGHDIQVHLFGSSGNMLCSDDSDVDICITTEWKQLESVCLIADLLSRHGMQKVVCVSSAKVPIVKIWDPELNLACDMNVNNTLALENTRMVRTYVEIDERVRPLAMIIKYWTRRRIVNDAAFGGTLSSYTWICLIIAFLQLRDPPVLPALHQRHHQTLVKEDGTRSQFADDLDKLRGFGSSNQESLASLLFHFFRFYAHEFDYDKWALSIRLGKLITKVEKNWQFGTNNLLCVEEPFNTIRNLGNTADDTSFRGLHLELRRAFDLIAEGKLAECCEEYVFPKEEERIWQKPAPAPRPVLLRSSSQQNSGRGGGRGGFRGSRQFRNGNSSRRASSSVPQDPNAAFTPGMPIPLNPQEIMWYQTQSSQLGMPQELLASSLNALHETNLRFQLYTQAQQINQQQALAHAQRMQGGGSTQSTDRPRTNSFDNPPLTAPLRPELVYGFPIPMQHTPYFHPGFTTYPTSPAASVTPTNGTSEYRRSLHRSSVANDSTATGGGTLRSQSQPASRSSLNASQASAYPAMSQAPNGMSVQSRQVNGVPVSGFVADEAADTEFDDRLVKPGSESPPEGDVAQYMGYYVHDGSNPGVNVNGFPGPVPSLGDVTQNGQGRRRPSADQSPQSVLDRRMRRTSRSPSPLGHARAFSVGTSSAPLTSAPFQQSNGKLTANRGPLVVNGSVAKPIPASTAPRQIQATENLTPEDSSFDNPLHINQGFGLNSPRVEQSPGNRQPSSLPSPSSSSERPVIVNGTSTSRSPVTAQAMADASFHHRMAFGGGFQHGFAYSPMGVDMNGMAAFSPPTVGRSLLITRQQQNGIASLDLATDNRSFMVTPDLHLSPVYEHRTPSPTVVRRFDGPSGSPKAGLPKEGRPEGSRSSKTPPSRSPPTGPSGKQENLSSPSTSNNIRENGHMRTGKNQGESFSNWQRQKTRKKGMADLKQAASSSSQGEQLPKIDSERKGG